MGSLANQPSQTGDFQANEKHTSPYQKWWWGGSIPRECYPKLISGGYIQVSTFTHINASVHTQTCTHTQRQVTLELQGKLSLDRNLYERFFSTVGI